MMTCAIAQWFAVMGWGFFLFFLLCAVIVGYWLWIYNVIEGD